MRVINVPVVLNGVETMQQEKIYEIEELAYLGKLLHCKDVKKRELKKTINYLQTPCAFDIETTNLDDIQQAVMYVWQFQIAFRKLFRMFFQSDNRSRH